MRVYFDHSTPQPLKRSFADHVVRTAPQMGWQEVKDGPLLDKVQKAGFEVMVTGDKNIYSQQNLEGRKLAIVALGTNNWNVLKENLPPIIAAVNQARPGTYNQLIVEHTKVQQKPSQEHKAPEKVEAPKKLQWFSDTNPPKPGGIKH